MDVEEEGTRCGYNEVTDGSIIKLMWCSTIPQ